MARTVNLQRRYRSRHCVHSGSLSADPKVNRDITDTIEWPSCQPSTTDITGNLGRDDDPYFQIGQIKTLTFGQVSFPNGAGGTELIQETRGNELDIAAVVSDLKLRVGQDTLDALWTNHTIRGINYDQWAAEEPGVDGVPNNPVHCASVPAHSGAEIVQEFPIQVYGPRPGNTGENIATSNLTLDIGVGIVRSQVKFFQPTDYSIIEVAPAISSLNKLAARVVVELGSVAAGVPVDVPLPSVPGFGYVALGGQVGDVLLSAMDVQLIVGQSGSAKIAELASDGYVQVPSWG